MAETHTGRCLCGDVRFETEGKPMWVAHCHCESCRRNNGAALATFAGFQQTQFRYVQGEPRTYVSSPGVRRNFCGNCGTPLTYEADRCPDEIHVHISTLDQPADFPPTAQVFVAEQLPWLHVDEHLNRYKGMSRDD